VITDTAYRLTTDEIRLADEVGQRRREESATDGRTERFRGAGNAGADDEGLRRDVIGARAELAAARILEIPVDLHVGRFRGAGADLRRLDLEVRCSTYRGPLYVRFARRRWLLVWPLPEPWGEVPFPVAYEAVGWITGPEAHRVAPRFARGDGAAIIPRGLLRSISELRSELA
jgi:hypothetical protein